MYISVCLRDLGIIPHRIIVEAKREINFETLDPNTDLTDRDAELGAFEDFVRQVRATLPTIEENVDVYVGWWGDQTMFLIPQEFFQLIAETRWPVNFNIND